MFKNRNKIWEETLKNNNKNSQDMKEYRSLEKNKNRKLQENNKKMEDKRKFINKFLNI